MKEKKEEVGLNRLERNRSLEKSEYKRSKLCVKAVNQLVKKLPYLTVNEAEYLMKNYRDRGGCYPSRP